MSYSSPQRPCRLFSRGVVSRRNTNAGFTLVELLVVIGIIALLISILLPSLTKAREAANRIKCASNLRQIGIGIRFFADDFQGRIPSGRDDWGQWIQGIHYNYLINRLRLNPDLFVCPSVTPSWNYQTQDIHGGGLWWQHNAQPYQTMQDDQQEYADEETNLIDPGDVSKWSNAGYNDPIVQTNYWYMGWDWRSPGFGYPHPNSPHWGVWVYKLTDKSYDQARAVLVPNPPLMSDATWQQPSGAGFKQTWNHGRSWKVDAAGNIKSDILTNTLYTDDHVETNTPVKYIDTSDMYGTGNSWYR